MTELRKKTLKGITWSSLSQVGKITSQFLVTIVLARLLNPEDFGLLGMANIFIYLAANLNEQGPSTALIQNQKVDHSHFSSIFWINVGFGLLLSFCFFSGAPLIAQLFEKQDLVEILRLLSPIFIFFGFSVVQRTILKKEMNFKRLAFIDNFSFLLGGIVGITLAFQGFGVKSLVFQTLTTSFSSMIFLWIFSSWKPQFLFSLQAIKDLFYFTVQNTGNSLLTYLSLNVDYFIIGKFLGAEALGYYTLAFKLMMFPIRHIVWIISEVLFPAFSKIQDDLKKVRVHYLIATKGIGLVVSPLLLGLFILAPEFVYSTVGPKWGVSIMVIRIFCFVGLFKAFNLLAATLIVSQGRPDLRLRLQIINFLSVTVFLLIGLRWGLIGVTCFYALQQFLWIPSNSIVAMWLIKCPLKNLMKVLVLSVRYSIPMVVILYFLRKILFMGNLANLIAFSVLGGILYLGMVWFFEREFIKDHTPFWQTKRKVES